MTTTSLQSQLNILKSKQKSQPVLPYASSPTLLFDFKYANRIDSDTIYEIGYSGILELSRSDNSFVKFIPKLFDSTAKYFNRRTKTEEELLPVDKEISSLLIELTPHFMKKASHKVLEYLIKIYHANIFNSKFLILSSLIYHDTKYFIKLMQNINFKNENQNFLFLEKFASAGIIIPKDSLLKYALSNLNFIIEVTAFYEDNYLSPDHLHINDLNYFIFIVHIFLHKLDNFSMKDANSNLHFIKTVVQFLNSVLKSFKKKEDLGFISDESIRVKTLCELIITIENKTKVNIEYTRAIISGLITKVLTHSKQGITMQTIMKTVLILSNNISSGLFSKESLSEMDQLISEQKKYGILFRKCIGELSHQYNITPIFISIILSADKNFPEVSGLLKQILKLSNIPSNLFGSIMIVLFQLNDAYQIDNILSQSIQDFIKFCEAMHPSYFNLAVINILKQDPALSEKIKFVLQTNSQDHDPYTLYLNLIGTNNQSVTFSLQTLDNLLSTGNINEEMLETYITALSGKFSFMESESLLSQIFSMKNFTNLLQSNQSLRENVLDFFYRIKENNLNTYSPKFIQILEKNLLDYYNTQHDESTLQIILYSKILFKSKSLTSIKFSDDISCETPFSLETFCEFLRNNVNTKMNDRSYFILFKNFIDKSIDSSFLDIDCIMKTHELLLLPDSNYDNNLLQSIIHVLSTESIRSYETIFNSLTFLFINGLSIDKVNNPMEYFSLIHTISMLIIFDTFNQKNFNLLLEKNFPETMQIFIAYTLTNAFSVQNVVPVSYLEYIKNLIVNDNNAEFILIMALMTSLLHIPHSEIIIDMLSISTRKIIKFSAFSSLFKKHKPKKGSSTDETIVKKMLSEIILHKNEIKSNRDYLETFICKTMDAALSMDVYLAMNGTLLANFNLKLSQETSVLLKPFSKFENTRSPALENMKQELLSLYLPVISQVSSSEDKEGLMPLIELLLRNYINIFPNSSMDVVEIIIDENNTMSLSSDFIDHLLEQTSLKLKENIKIDLLFKILKIAVKYSISSRHIKLKSLSDNDDCTLDMLEYIIKNKIIQADQSTVLYCFDVIFKISNGYYSIDHVIRTMNIIKQLMENPNHDNNSLLSICHNLHIIISTLTVNSNDSAAISNIFEDIRNTIISVIFNYSNEMEEDESSYSKSIEISQIVDKLLKSVNKLIIVYSSNTKKEHDFLKTLIQEGIAIIERNKSLNFKIKDEMYLIFINSVINVIQLLGAQEKEEALFCDFLHILAKAAFEHIQDDNLRMTFLGKFLEMPLMRESSYLLACFLSNVHLYNNTLANSALINSKIIVKTIDENLNDMEGLTRGVNIIKHILNNIDQCKNGDDDIASVNNHKAFHSLILTNSIINIIGSSIINSGEDDSEKLPPVFLAILLNVSTRQKRLAAIEKKSKDIRKIVNENNKFLITFFSILSKSNYISQCLSILYSSDSFYSIRYEFLNTYLNIIKSNHTPRLNSILEILVQIALDKKENRVENLTMIFSIGECIITLSKCDCKILKKLLPLVIKFFEENLKTKLTSNSKNIHYAILHYTIGKFISKVFSIYPENTFLNNLNNFLTAFNQGISYALFFRNEELTVMIIESILMLANHLSEYLSPCLDELVWYLMQLAKTKESNKEMVNQILEKIAKANLFDVSYQAVKYCTKKLIKDENETYDFSILMLFLSFSLQTVDKLVIADLYPSILKFFIKILLEKKVDPKFTWSILDSFRAFILKVNEKQLKVLFGELIKYTREKPNLAEEDSSTINARYKISNCIVAFQLLNTILTAISGIFVPYFEKYKSIVFDIILFLNATFSIEDRRKSGKKKTNRMSSDCAYEEEEKYSYLKLNTLILENIKLNFKYNNDQLLADTIEDLIEPLCGQFKFQFFGKEKMVKYFEEEIIDCIVEVLKNTKSDDLFKQLNDSILNLIREDNYISRLLTLKTVEVLLQKLKERYLLVLSDVVPFITDSLEDLNEDVHNQAFKTMKTFEKITGDDFKNYFE